MLGRCRCGNSISFVSSEIPLCSHCYLEGFKRMVDRDGQRALSRLSVGYDPPRPTPQENRSTNNVRPLDQGPI